MDSTNSHARQELVTGHRSCPACGSDSMRDQGRKNDFQLLSCRSCGTLYISPLPSEGHAKDYDDYYDARTLSIPDFIADRLDEIVAGFAPYRRTNRFLDVGFGAGSLMRAAARRLGCRGNRSFAVGHRARRRVGLSKFSRRVERSEISGRSFRCRRGE